MNPDLPTTHLTNNQFTIINLIRDFMSYGSMISSYTPPEIDKELTSVLSCYCHL